MDEPKNSCPRERANVIYLRGKTSTPTRGFIFEDFLPVVVKKTDN